MVWIVDYAYFDRTAHGPKAEEYYVSHGGIF